MLVMWVKLKLAISTTQIQLRIGTVAVQGKGRSAVSKANEVRGD